MRQFFGEKIFFLLALSTLMTLVCAGPASADPTHKQNIQSAAKEPSSNKGTASAKTEANSSDKADEAEKDEQPADKSDKKTADDAGQDKKDVDADKKKEAAKKSDKSAKKSKKKSKPHKVKREKLKIEVELDGIFVADEMEEVILRPEVWSQFKILEAVEHGTSVKKGDVLIRFDDEKLEKELAEESLNQSIGQLSMMKDEEEFPRNKQQLELSFAAAKRRHKQMQADFDYYHSTDRPITVRIAHFRYKSAQQQLAAAQEELDQLQQMYDADELTEQTEEIVLSRQRFAVETAKLSLDLGKENRDYTLNVSVPRNDKRFETMKKTGELAFQQAKTAYETGMTRMSYDMEKKRNLRAKSIERHGKLLSDKNLMTVRAPADGVVYYGKCSKGKWSQVASLKAKLKPFGSASAKSVLMTIVKPGSLHIESSLSEKNFTAFKTGQTATIVPNADKDLEFSGQVTQLDSIPGASNKFDVQLSVDHAAAPAWLAAGLTCKAKVLTYENPEALVIPLDLVQTDEDDSKIKYVMLVEEDDVENPVRRNVKLGRKKSKTVEVLKGLDEGDQIVKEEKKKEDKD